MYYQVRVIHILIFSLIVCSLANGCAWQRIKPEVIPTATNVLPINVGIQLTDTPVSGTYGPMVIAKLREYNTFQSITFPYRQGDPVDGVVTLDISGSWKGNSGANFGKGFVIGLSLFTLSTVMGPSMKGEHAVMAVLGKEAEEVGRYQTSFETKVTWGMLANTDEVSQKSDTLQVSKIATFVSESIQKDWPRMGAKFKK